MPATLLSMSQNVAMDAGYSNSIQSVASATGDSARIVKYTRDAASYIQTKWGDWRFLWGGLLRTTVGVGTTNIPAPLNHYRWDQGRMFFDGHLVTPVMFHDFVPWAEMDQPGYPTMFVIMPDSSIEMYPPPDGDYTLNFSWYKEAPELNLDTDTPLMPDRFHRAIENYALWLYAMYDDAAELAAKSNAEYEKWLYLLEADQRPDGYATTQSSGNNLVITAD